MKPSRRIGISASLAAALAFSLGAFALPAHAYIPGDGKGKPEADCFIGLEGYEPGDQTGFGNKQKLAIQCTDCDPACDLDGVDEPNGSCTFSIAIRVNDAGVPTCTPAALKKIVAKAKTKGTKINFATSFQPPLDGTSATSSFVDFPVRVKGKKQNKPGKGTVVVKAKKAEKPRLNDKDKFLFVCNPLPEGQACPGATTTTVTTVPTSTTTTTCPPPGETDPTQLLFTNSAPTEDCGGSTRIGNEGVWEDGTEPFSGQLLDGEDNVLGNLGLSCLYLGGGSAFNVPPGGNPDNATNTFAIGGVCDDGTLQLAPDAGTSHKDCTLGPDTTSSCVDILPATTPCTQNTDCTPTNANSGACAPDANCFFGTPLPIANGGLSTCVINAILDGVGGTVTPATGEADIAMPLQSRVYLTGNGTLPCPTCIEGVCDPDWRTGSPAAPSPNAGEACTAEATTGVTHDCLPAGIFVGRIPVDLTPLTTGTTMLEPTDTACLKSPSLECVTASDCPTVCSGSPNQVCETSDNCPVGQTCGGDRCTAKFCPGQVPEIGPGLYGAFGLLAPHKIIQVGDPAGDITEAPGEAILASTFCIPATGNGLIDGSADLPGPGATSLPGTLQLVGN